MHSFGTNNLSILNLNNFGVTENSTCVFVFGEIDVRCHIGRQRDQKNRDINEILDVLVTNYINAINLNRSFYKNIKCVVLEVIPPSEFAYNADYPYWGNLKDRVDINYQLNQKLKLACIKSNILFLEINDIYSINNGSLNYDLSDKIVHISTLCNDPIKEKLLSKL